jgi:hypothetical protein
LRRPSRERTLHQLATSLLCLVISLPNNLSVNSARDTVLKLQVHFRNGVLRKDGRIRNITYPNISRRTCSQHSQRTNSGRLNHVSDGESLDSLVFRRASAAVGAADRLHMAAALLVASTVRFISYAVHKTGTSNGNIYLDALFLTIFAV